MKLKFDAQLDFQQEAIQAVADVFQGQPLAESRLSVSLGAGTFMGVEQTELGVGNRLVLDDGQLLANVQRVQEANSIAKVPELQGRHFSIEMETGTGKTYVYLRTIFELNRLYGFTKFIVVVPSIAIREGVLKSIDVMKEHFQALYDHVPFDHFVYDSKRMGQVRQFATSNAIQIMVINIQAFQRDVKDADEIARMSPEELKKLALFNRDSDRLSGRSPKEFVQATNPIVIIDEPQSVEGDTSRGETVSSRAIRQLNPLCTLRYSATHKNVHNLLYKLGPIDAYDRRLVKRIEVASVRAEDSLNEAFVRLEDVDNRNGLKAKLTINVGTGAAAKQKKVAVKQGDNLFVKSRERQEYQTGFIVRNLSCEPGAEYVEFTGGQVVTPDRSLGSLHDDVMRAQVFETVEQHLRKEKAVKGKGVKVLSLFFIDRVANYRVYQDDGATGLGKIGQWFEEAYGELRAKPMYRGVLELPVEQVHGGYFSQDKDRPKDTSGTTKADEDTYHLIMRDKERLLSHDEPLRFIFSHTALREGWDNPNVFQICTLNETRSTDRKRQEIGRGLRLPVNQDGERVHDETINRLTVVANESYHDFASKLQTEYEEDYGVRFGIVPKEAFAKLTDPAGTGDERLGQDQSRALWEGLRQAGYVDAEGAIQDKFDPSQKGFKLELPAAFAPIEAEVIDRLKGFLFKNRVVNTRDRKEIKFRKQVMLDPDFEELWRRISQRTRYRVAFSTDELVKEAAKKVKAMPAIEPLKIHIDHVGVDMTEAGVGTDRVLGQRVQEVAGPARLPDILAYLQNETELTRHTLVRILVDSGRLPDFAVNPQAFITETTRRITRVLNGVVLQGIRYEKIDGVYWDMHRLERDAEDGLLRYLTNLYAVQHADKCVYDHVEFDSEVERRFAEGLDNNEQVKLFVKLPSWFKVDTPVGPYNPDWAIVYEGDEKVYLVRETKSTADKEELRTRESQKVACGEKHFAELGVDFKVVTTVGEAVGSR